MLNFRTETKNQLEYERIELIKEGEICEYKLCLKFKEKACPSPYSIIWEQEHIDTYGFWSSKGEPLHNITPDWYVRKEESRTASGMPLISLYNKANYNRLTVALSDPSNPTTLSAGVVEENTSVKIQIDLFSQLCPPIKEYELIIRIDRRNIPFYKCVQEVKAWWENIGYQCAYVPKEAYLPMYSTWYSFHQHTIPEEIIKECKWAKEYGMDTVIVDDGWQTDDNSRGYAFCGDWQVCEKKIPDMKGFVDEIHSLGMKVMFWFSVPFVGFESKNYERFKGKYVTTRQASRASVLDPRFKEVREFLVQTYVNSVKKYGWDGLKLDFIDSFKITEESSQDYDNMDTVSLEEGVQLLLKEATEALKAINPEFLIEFRQSYVGPAISKYGNIFRVTDCPCDPIYNRIFSLKLRLTSGKTAVHSDMIIWNKNDTNESVKYQLLSVLFAVPQISVRWDNISDEHKTILKKHLNFVREKSDILLNGEIYVQDADAGYTMAQSTKNGECISVLYHSVVKPVKEKTEYIFNSTGEDYIYVESDKGRKYEIYDIFGSLSSSGEISKGVQKVNVKNCQMVTIKA